MNLPSIKTLSQVTTWPRELRKLLECESRKELDALIEADKPFKRSSFEGNFQSVDKWIRECFNSPSFHDTKMHMADILCETCGVEYIPRGHNDKSPAIEFLNAGDTYAATLLYVNRRYRVGCWGDIVERGHYD